jgi:nicotinate phosphoribosyltransferase
MQLKPIITSLLQNDAYKFNMGNVIFLKFNDKITYWRFKNRTLNIKFTPDMIQEIREQVDYLCTLMFTNEELEYLRKNFPWLSDGYINFLKYFKLDRNEIKINEGNIQPYEGGNLAIEAKGTWLSTSFFEIPILAIVNEVYFAFTYGVGAKDIEFQKRTIEKFNGLNASNEYDIGTFAEFGMRRRYSSDMQDWLIKYIVNQKIPGFVGTSNVYLAKKYGVKAIGTQAHEMGMTLMTDQQYNCAYVNRRLMKVWTDVYGTKNGIYLTDLIGREAFLMDFNDRYATLFSGVRHDSGDPVEWGEDMIAHYKKLGIDPMTKTLLFSDSLDFERAIKIYKHFNGRIKTAFGIGTFLSNDTDVGALNIVMKVVEADGYPTCKLTDNPEKAMGDNQEYIDFVKRSIDWRIRYEK